ncbi:MAG: hypothetical protein EOP45_15885 [Sphingobacteriaceae bacterium]|nr:MAG: hypothetical protein EOP45_15885 [Sphingobacteriaceae bacterium]
MRIYGFDFIVEMRKVQDESGDQKWTAFDYDSLSEKYTEIPVNAKYDIFGAPSIGEMTQGKVRKT